MGDVTGSLWRALAVLRLVLVAFAVVVAARQWDDHERPVLTSAVLAGIAAWSGIATLLYAKPRRRYRWVLAADLAVAIGALLLTPYAQGAEMLARHAATVPSYWIAAPVLAIAIHRGWRSGLVAAIGVGVVDMSIRAEIIDRMLGNAFLLCLAAVVVGYTGSLVRLVAAQRAEAAALVAATEERERLARAVHDGVLQVLAYVQRRGVEIGGPTAELGRLAGDQEAALRGLIRSQPEAQSGHSSDLASMLQRLADPTVSVAVPSDAVALPAPVAAELLAATSEAVANARRHAPDARVFVLLEDEPDAVTVSISDDGPGIPDGRLDEAAQTGRLGIPESIIGRIRSLGGTPVLHTGGDTGTEWELRVPRD